MELEKKNNLSLNEIKLLSDFSTQPDSIMEFIIELW